MNKKEIKKELKHFVAETIIPFLLPILFSVIPEDIISKLLQNILLVIVALADVVYIMIIKRKDILERKELASKEFELKQYQIEQKIMNKLLNCEKMKGDFLKEGVDNLEDNMLSYKPHLYLERVCEELRNLISEISNISLDCITVSFIYKYPDKLDKWDGWQWINWKEPSCNLALGELIGKIDSLFYYLIDNNKVKFFENNKRKLIKNGNYWPGEKDKRYKEYGSIASYRMSFINKSKTLCTGYLTISTYGKKFYSKKEKNDYYSSKEEFEKILSELIIAKFRDIIQTELGFLFHGNNINLWKENSTNISKRN